MSALEVGHVAGALVVREPFLQVALPAAGALVVLVETAARCGPPGATVGADCDAGTPLQDVAAPAPVTLAIVQLPVAVAGSANLSTIDTAVCAGGGFTMGAGAGIGHAGLSVSGVLAIRASRALRGPRLRCNCAIWAMAAVRSALVGLELTSSAAGAGISVFVLSSVASRAA